MTGGECPWEVGGMPRVTVCVGRRACRGAAALPGYFNGVAAIGFGYEAAKSHCVAIETRMTGNRCPARAAERSEKSPLGRERGVGVGIVDRCGMRTGALISGARLDGDRTLTCRRQKLLDLECRGHRRKKSEPL